MKLFNLLILNTEVFSYQAYLLAFYKYKFWLMTHFYFDRAKECGDYDTVNLCVVSYKYNLYYYTSTARYHRNTRYNFRGQ